MFYHLHLRRHVALQVAQRVRERRLELNLTQEAIALTPDGLCAFEYSAQFLNSGRSISPFELPLRGGVTIAKRHPFDGGFGVLTIVCLMVG